MIYQSCGPTTRESCNCAVAVKSYDDVFVVDKCRLRTNGSSDNSESLRVMKVTLFVNGRLNRATRIFRKHGGMAYQVNQHNVVVLQDMMWRWFIKSK